MLLTFVPSYFSKAIAAFAGFRDLPSASARAIVALAAVILAVSVVTMLTLLNPRILSWRKARGRDIKDEERYESDHGMIGLIPKDKDNPNR